MHLHYFTLKHLADFLHPKLSNTFIADCFSQDKDELILAFAHPDYDFFLRVSCQPGFSFVLPLDSYNKARKNVPTLFPHLMDAKVLSVECVPYEREILIKTDQNRTLILKMHGNQSNVLWMSGDEVKEIFRTNLEKDYEYRPLGGTFDFSLAETEVLPDEQQILKALRQISPIFSKPFAGWIKSEMDAGSDFTDAFRATLNHCGDERFYISYSGTLPDFYLLPPHEGNYRVCEGIAACLGDFVGQWFRSNRYLQLYARAKQALDQAEKRLKKQIASYEKNLQKLDDSRDPGEMGDILMANMHVLEKGEEQAELDDLYLGGKVKIRLDPQLSPQENAAKYYRKQKKRKEEKKHVEALLMDLYAEQEVLDEKLDAFARFQAPDEHPEAPGREELKDISEFLTDEGLAKEKRVKNQKAAFYEFEKDGFVILAGKTAQQNDELTLHVAARDDLWLHAKDVSGSHVVIRLAGRKSAPPQVIAFAAAIAAGLSKRKHDSLVAVTVCPRKYVRKRKGDPPGAVVVEREEVVMVEPLSPREARERNT